MAVGARGGSPRRRRGRRFDVRPMTQASVAESDHWYRQSLATNTSGVSPLLLVQILTARRLDSMLPIASHTFKSAKG